GNRPPAHKVRSARRRGRRARGLQRSTLQSNANFGAFAPDPFPHTEYGINDLAPGPTAAQSPPATLRPVRGTTALILCVLAAACAGCAGGSGGSSAPSVGSAPPPPSSTAPPPSTPATAPGGHR